MIAFRCPLCLAKLSRFTTLVGALGSRTWHRCKWCGGEFSRESTRPVSAPLTPTSREVETGFGFASFE